MRTLSSTPLSAMQAHSSLRLVIISMLQLLFSASVQADHPSPGLGSGMAGPINTLPAETLSEGQWTAGFRTEYLELDDISNTKLSNLSEKGKTAHSTDYLISPSVGVAYGVTDNFMIAGQLPYVKRRGIREAGHHDDEGGHEEEHEEEEEEHEEGSVEKLGDSEGIGDATLYGQYRFINDASSGLQASVLLGIKMPTGETHEKTKDGERFEAEHQPGSGSWDPLFGLALVKPWNAVSLGASLLYTHATEGSQDTDLGDGIFYGVSLSHRLGTGGSHSHHDHGPHAEWDAVLELNGEWRDKVDIDNADDNNTGGHVLFIAPGVRYGAAGGWAAALSLGVPVINNLNGTQSEPDWRVIGNIGYAF